MNLLKISASYLWFTLCLAHFSQAVAAPRTDKEATEVVAGWLAATPKPLATALIGRMGQTKTFRDSSGEVIYYVIALDPQGFVVASPDSDLEPIISFSAEGSFDPNPHNPLFAMLQRDLPERLAQAHGAAKVNTLALSPAQAKWARFAQYATPMAQDNGIPSVDDLRVTPFIQSRWNQSTIWNGSAYVACYNYYTPPYASGASSNYVCGCNNTAWAQIMRYYNYPTIGVGTNTFNIFVDGVATNRLLRGGDGLGGPYAWNLMTLVPGASTTELQRQAIGALTADIGVAAGTGYASDGSGALLSGQTLRSVFFYSNAIYGSGLGDQFANQVHPNLDAKFPVCFWITDSSGDIGHVIVCDGYGYNVGTLYHHLNMGWGGYYDAWYNLPTVDAGGYDFTVIKGFYYNIYTNGTGEIISGRVLDPTGIPVANAAVTATFLGGGSYSATTDTNGIYALTQLPSASQFQVTVTKTGYASMNANYSTGVSSDYGITSGNVWGANFILTYLEITPGSDFYANGPVGGPFNITPQIYSLTNLGKTSLNWTLANTSVWLNASLSGGTLSPGGSANIVSVGLNAAATNLPDGYYTANIWFTNLNDGVGQGRQFSLLVGQGTSVVQNGGFETGDFTDWVGSGNWKAGGFGYENVWNTDAHSGVFRAYLAPPSSLGYISQTLQTVVGQTYLLSLWFNNTNGGSPNEFLVSWGGNTLFDQTNIAKTAWTNMQFKVVATGNNTVLKIGFRNDAAYMALDDISATPFSYDIQGPSLTITSPANGSTVIDPSLTITGIASDNGLGGHGISSVTVNGITAIGGSAIDNGAANWNAAMILNLGQNALTVIASDLLNNSTTQQVTVTYKIPDTQSPVLNIMSPISGQTFSNVAVQVTGTASDNIAVASVWLQINSGDWIQAAGTTNWYANMTLSPGTNTIAANAVDASGNKSTTNSVTFKCVFNSVLVVTTNGIGTFSPNYNGASLQAGATYSMTATATTGKGFAFTNWTGGTNLPLVVLTNGAMLKFVMLPNLMLQANFADTNKPALSITNLTAGQRWSNLVFMAKGTATDNWHVASVQCQMNGGIWTNATGTTNWSTPLTLTPGTNTIAAYATDTTGNNSPTNSMSFQFVVTNRLGVQATGLGTISPNYSNAWLEIGRNYSITSSPAKGFVFANWIISTNWLGGISMSKTNFQFMMASNLTLQANFLDVTRPTNTVTAPTSGQHMTNALATVVGIASDNWKVAGVWYQLNNGAWNATATSNGWTNWSTTLQLTTGTNSVKAYAVDLGGNFSTTNSLSVVSSNTFKLELAFTNALPMKTNGLVFSLQLSTGLNGHIQVSTNLTSWTTLTNFVGTNTTLNFRDPAATNSSQRFYRAIIP